MNKTSKVVVVIVLILVVLFGIGQFFASPNIQVPATSQTPSSQTPPTEVIAYQATLPQAGTVPVENGTCFSNSIAAPYRLDAWRCSVGNSISDPCFAIASSTNLLCGINPSQKTFATSTFVLHLTKALPNIPRDTVTRTDWAWAVELGDGTYCTPFTGTRPFTASGTVGVYACVSSNPSEAMIFGDLNTSSSVWQATVGSLKPVSSSLPIVQYSSVVPVATVWQ